MKPVFFAVAVTLTSSLIPGFAIAQSDGSDYVAVGRYGREAIYLNKAESSSRGFELLMDMSSGMGKWVYKFSCAEKTVRQVEATFIASNGREVDMPKSASLTNAVKSAANKALPTVCAKVGAQY